MSLSTLRPTGTSSNTGALTGGATAHAVLADNSDASFVTLDPGESFEVSLGDFSQPAGSMISFASLRLRLKTNGSVSVIDVTLLGESGGTGITWTSPTTITAYSSPHNGSVDDTDLDAATVLVSVSGEAAVVYELYLDVFYVDQPIVSVLTPTGTIDTNLPEIDWTDTLDTAGGGASGQSRYEVKIFSDAQYGAGGFDPDTSTPTQQTGQVVSSATSYKVTTLLADDTWRAYVRVAQTTNNNELFWSEWDYVEFTTASFLPGEPLVDVTAQDDQGRFRIDIAATEGDLETEQFEVERLTDGAYVSIRTLLGDGLVEPIADGATIYDYEAPNGIATTYRVRALSTGADGPVASGWASDTDTWSSTSWWLKHPTDPDFNCPVVPDSVPVIVRSARQGVFPVLGATYPVVVDDSRGGAAGTITFRLDTAEEQEALVAILSEGVTVLLQGRAVDNWTDRWVRFGDLESARIVDKSWVEPTYETLPWIEVAAPTDNLGEWLGEGS